jgi:polygalacturonase
MNIVRLAEAGGKSGEGNDNSAVLRRLLDDLGSSGGGTLIVGPGLWRTGPIDIRSRTSLELEEGAVLSFIPDPELYRPVRSRWEGIECHAMHPCIFASGATGIRLTGSGRIDGNGSVWWELFRRKRAAKQKLPELPIERELAALNPGYLNHPGGGGGREIQFLRPSCVQFFDCTDVTIEGITISNSPFWTVHPVYCDGLKLSRLFIKNPPDAPNTDGIDIDSCRNVEIVDCHVSVGDDGIALKSGSGPDGIRANKPTEFVTVRNCVVEDAHGGVVIGSETAAGVRDVLVERCVFRGTDRGIRIKTRRGRGGKIANLEFRDLTIEGCLCPVAINMYYRCGASPDDKSLFSASALPVTATTPSIDGVRVSRVRATGCRASAGFIAGLPESPVEHLAVEDCSFSTEEASGVSPDESDMFAGLPSVEEKSIRVLNARDPVFRNVTVQGPAEAFIHR